MENLLEVKNLQVHYETDKETVYAVNGVSFTIQNGETLGLVGETGAGKTTISLAILQLLSERTARIPKGEIYFKGKNLLDLGEKEMQLIRGEEISMIFQDPMTALNPIMTIGKQIAEALRLHNHQGLSLSEIEEKVDEVLKMVGIPPERKTEYPHQFSGGMKQRVVIAIALACEPQLLIADEPTTALDVTIQAQVLLMMKRLRQQLGTSMILITHDLGVVSKVCDNVAVIYAGEIVEYGTLRDVFSGKVHHPYTVGLFGSIPSLTAKTRRLQPIEGLMPDPTKEVQGCRFADRCPHVREICRRESPSIFAEGSHQVKCHLFREEEKHA
ncbi:MAG: ABC transporter ATP-binding protein [Anaerovoracaceae bacterium]